MLLHKYLLSLCTFFGKSKISHLMDFDFGHVTYFDQQNGREWDISHIPQKTLKCSGVLCFGLSHFCKVKDMWHQFNLYQQSGSPTANTYDHLWELHVVVNCWHAQSIIIHHQYSKSKVIQKVIPGVISCLKKNLKFTGFGARCGWPRNYTFLEIILFQFHH